MIFGLSIPAFTILHVAISIIGIGLGLVWLGARLRGRWAPAWNLWFLLFTIATSVTGFMFPVATLTPAQIVGYVSLVDLALAAAALLIFGREGIWRSVYDLAAIFALYLNVFVAVVQSFLKIPVLNALAPNGTELPFVVTQAVVLGLFSLAAWKAIRLSAVELAERPLAHFR